MDYKINTDCKGIKHNPSLGQTTGLQKKLGMTCKQNVLYNITEGNKKTTNQKAEGTREDHWRLLDV
jgi:hypothetical protein